MQTRSCNIQEGQRAMTRTTPLRTPGAPATLALLTIAGFLGGATSVHAQGRRVWAADSFWTRTWVRGGTSEAELLVEPRHLAVAGANIVVLDMGTREVLGFSLANGRTVFHHRATGEGPGEFRRPGLLAPSPDGFLLLDHATSRLSRFDSNGRYRASTPVSNGFAVESVCANDSGTILLKLMGARDALHTLLPDGKRVDVRSLPWPGRGAESILSSGVLAGAGASAMCALLPRYGSEWLVVPRSGASAVHRYVRAHRGAEVRTSEQVLERSIGGKRVEQTQLVDGEPAIVEAFAVGDTVIVRDGGDRAAGYRILDYYLLPSGRYLHSRRIPPGFTRLAAAGGGTFVGAHLGEELSSLVALSATAAPPPKRSAASRADSRRPVAPPPKRGARQPAAPRTRKPPP